MPTSPHEPAAEGVLVGVDLRGIQAFVFETRRLLDAVGRAEMVAELTTRAWLDERLYRRHGAEPPTYSLEREHGGTLVAGFADRTAAREFTGRYTREVRKRSDRLVPVVAHLPYGPDEPQRTLAEALAALPGELATARGRAVEHLPARGFGVTALCEVTGRPAEVVDQPPKGRGGADRPAERVAHDIVEARRVGSQWHRRQREAWLDAAARPDGWTEDLDLPTDVEELGRDVGDISRLAVIHLDFNGLGDLLARFTQELAPGEIAAELRRVSADIHAVTAGLAEAITRAVARAITLTDDGEPVITGRGNGGSALRPAVRSPEHGRRRTLLVPVRPLVVAGDDLTILCDARLAWSVTRFALDWLDGAPTGPKDPRHRMVNRGAPWARPVWDGPDLPPRTTGVPTAGVGIAVQPVGSSLAVGYDICAALCKHAKEQLKAEQRRKKQLKKAEGERADGAIDDHVVAWSQRFDAPERVVGSLAAARGESGTDGRTALPMTGTRFRAFLDGYLADAHGGSGAPGVLRSPDMAEQRSWVLSDLRTLLYDGEPLEPELERRKARGVAAELPPECSRGELLDAIDLLDVHLDVALAEEPVRSGEGA
ncbi:hypothetical protein [Marinitenerispora sediminis]|uniref:Uncharacterized protein n=1 Tax=Marinitenerispora sediminis TaxID=1931232 RepID=A0A368T9S1_9ACTN|nr:hypothetical protein [Marinitenerispora sediminis]RCV52447.1 hypothetical protein DEF23_18920 [Marinitenerispora sediminis]RCV54972.1 hypothetical protein DEF28_06880 [Marinitenerispora sediminis]RCV61415.1 hypothetical protein DEF24_04250 [Marinitenerispora sediminis]